MLLLAEFPQSFLCLVDFLCPSLNRIAVHCIIRLMVKFE